MKTKSVAILALSLAACAFRTGTARAVTINVTKTADSQDGACDADCSLREAVLVANAVAPGPNLIVVPAGTYNLTINFPSLVCDLDHPPCPWDVAYGNQGGLYIARDVTIRGAGAKTTILNQTVLDRVIRVAAGAATIEDLTIQGGRSGGQNNGAHGTSRGLGGGVYVDAGASATIRRSAVRDNLAAMALSCGGPCGTIGSFGGGVYALGALTLDSSTVSGNEVQNGGGIFPLTARGSGLALLGDATIVNSTVSDNRTPQVPFTGGDDQIFAKGGTVTVRSSTLASSAAGQVFETTEVAGGTSASTHVTLNNTILVGTGCTAAAKAQTASLGYNLDQNGACALTAATDLSGDPLIAALADNGGDTETRALQAGSPAIDTGDPACPAADQRGQGRNLDGKGCDRGAYETPPAPLCGSVVGNADAGASAALLLAAAGLLWGAALRKAVRP